MLKVKQAEMQGELERVRDLAESWFDLTEEERDRLREEWSEKGYRRPPVTVRQQGQSSSA